MPRRAPRAVVPPSPVPEEQPLPELPEDDFVQSLKADLSRAQHREAEPAEDLSHRSHLNQRILQDLWEVHNQFEDVSVHLTVEPSQTLFATFVEYPTKWTFKPTFDFGAVKTIELKDRSQGWVGFTLRFWYYNTPEGKPHFRGIFEWSDGESYHRYTGWMRTISQAVLYDAAEPSVSLKDLHQVLRDIVVAWYSAHLEKSPEKFIEHLKEKYPRGASYARESYRS
jgi:hypothetical protein